MSKIHPQPEIALLLSMLDQGYNKTAWHGPNLRGTLRKLPAEQAVWRPRPGRRCIAEIAVHCAYWKYSVRRRLLGGKRGSFPLKGSNWFALPVRLDEPTWKSYVKLLDEQHRDLREAVCGVSPRRLNTLPTACKTTFATLIIGIAAHDLYHAGQIRTLKALYGSR